MANTDAIAGGAILLAAGWFYYHNGTPFAFGEPLDETSDPLETDNAGWSQYVSTQASETGFHPELVGRALNKFNKGQYLDGEEYAFMKSATDLWGNPSVQPDMPRNSPYRGLQTTTGPQPVNSPYGDGSQ